MHTWIAHYDYLIHTAPDGQRTTYNTRTSYQARQAAHHLHGQAPPAHMQAILDTIPAHP